MPFHPKIGGSGSSTGSSTWKAYYVTYTEASAGSGTHEVNLVLLSGPFVFQGCIIDILTPFQGGTLTAVTAQIGPTGAPTYTLANDVYSVAAGDQYLTTTLQRDNDIQIVVKFSATGGNLTQLSQGAMIIWLNTAVVTDPSP